MKNLVLLFVVIFLGVTACKKDKVQPRSGETIIDWQIEIDPTKVDTIETESINFDRNTDVELIISRSENCQVDGVGVNIIFREDSNTIFEERISDFPFKKTIALPSVSDVRVSRFTGSSIWNCAKNPSVQIQLKIE